MKLHIFEYFKFAAVGLLHLKSIKLDKTNVQVATVVYISMPFPA